MKSHRKNLSKTMQKVFMNCRSDKYFMWAVRPIIVSKLLALIKKVPLLYIENYIDS